MTELQKEIFLAAFLPDWQKLDSLILEEKDIRLSIPIMEDQEFWGRKTIEISVLEILQMNYDCWFDIKNKTKLINYEDINPKEIFQNNQKAIKVITKKLGFQKAFTIKYKNYCNFLWSSDDENWFDNDEVSTFIKEGYKAIDLELINFAIKRDQSKVTELMNKGANAYIDPDDKMYESAILHDMASDEGYYSIEYMKYYNAIINQNHQSLTDMDIYSMMRNLYGVASSSCIYWIIKSGTE